MPRYHEYLITILISCFVNGSFNVFYLKLALKYCKRYMDQIVGVSAILYLYYCTLLVRLCMDIETQLTNLKIFIENSFRINRMVLKRNQRFGNKYQLFLFYFYVNTLAFELKV